MSNTMPLQYLFSVTSKDGTRYFQNKEDKSVTEPELRSSFYDVKQDEVQSFSVSDDNHTYAVGLSDGHFEVDGVTFFMHTDMELKDFRLVYYRQHTHSFNSNATELDHVIVYCLGWQTNDKEGKNVQRIMTIK